MNTATTTYSWSCSDCGKAETGFNTKQAATNAAKQHKRENPGHNPIVSEENDMVSQYTEPDIDIDIDIEDRFRKLTSGGTRSLNGSMENGYKTCIFDLEMPQGKLLEMTDREVYDFIKGPGSDCLVKAYLGAKSVNKPRGGDLDIGCRINNKEWSCEGRLRISF